MEDSGGVGSIPSSAKTARLLHLSGPQFPASAVDVGASVSDVKPTGLLLWTCTQLHQQQED